MIDTLTIRGFKRFKSVSIPFRNLTVLTGVNGAGKSTALQALLLARQVAENPITNVVQLNGPQGLALGEANDVLHPEATKVEISVSENSVSYGYVFTLPDDRALNLTVGWLLGCGGHCTLVCAWVVAMAEIKQDRTSSRRWHVP